MKRLPVASCSVLLLMIFGSVAVLAQPAIIPRIGVAPHDAKTTFKVLKGYFGDSAASEFSLVSADPATRTIVAKRSGIDTQTWSEWAYCKMGPSHLIDSLRGASVTVNIKVERVDRHSSNVNVSADFEGTYGLGSNETTQHCISNGVLEQHILATAGVAKTGG